MGTDMLECTISAAESNAAELQVAAGKVLCVTTSM